ncbi:MAG: carbamate kinase [Candidatus Delongbacteria bacterium]|nr:carbamate kinase [Candidatus Delongbacteria bacterium]MCG2761453.1 carbamate kinase [Candidatus Delongbacteria bacterium]
MYNKRVVIAIGGNSLTPTDQTNWIGSQFKNTRTSIESLIPLVENGYSVAITHGNGPQVGIALRRVEETRSILPDVPLGILVADTEGSMGYMIEQSLQNKLFDKGIKIPVATILTQVVVDKNDPALLNPTKYIGSFYTEEEAKELAVTRGWIVKKDADRGWRRVVGSPKPIDIVNKNIIKQLLDMNNIVIAAGGGGIPVCLNEKKHFEGIDAVIDKDMASALLGNLIGADELYIMTAVSKVSLNFKTPNQIDLDKITMSETDKYLNEGHFPYGSMGPKMKSAVMFLRNGGKRVIITAIDKLMDAIEGKDGTSIVRD